MKQALTKILFFIAFFALSVNEAKACHGVPLVGFSATTNGTSVIVNGSSNAATCGCGPYYMEVELACFSASNFTGLAPTCTALTWNTYPWYRSLLNVPNYSAAFGWPDNCVVEPYNPVTINFSQLCPGTTYVLRARERVCGSGSAGGWSTTFTFTTPGTAPLFTITATATPSSVCPGNPSQLLATINGSGGCGSGTPIFTWTPISPAGPAIVGNPINVTPTVTTIYQVTATGGYLTCYSAGVTTVTVTVLPMPVAGVATLSPTTVCQNGCVNLTLTGYSGNIQWQQSPNGVTWTNIAGANSSPYQFCPVTAATYFRAVVTNNCGTVYSNTVVVNIIPVPTLTITPANPQICAGQSVILNVTGSSGYTWFDAVNNAIGTGSSITVSPTVTTTYTVSTTATCPASQTVTVVVNPLPVITFSPPSASICIGSSVTIDAGSNLNTYTWTPAASLTYLSASQDSVLAAPNATTSYVVTAQSPAGCIATNTVTVTINPSPVLTLSDDSLVICPNSTDTATISGAFSYVWSPMSGVNLLAPDGSIAEFNPASTTTYTVVGTTSSGCIDSTTIYVLVSTTIVVDAGLPDSICPGQSTTLQGSGGNQYSWTSNPASAITGANTSTPVVTPSTTTMYTAVITNQFGCFGTDSVEVLVRPLPVPDAGLDTALCVGNSITLNGSGGGTYSWAGLNITSGSATATPTIGPAASGDYIVTVTDGYGCTNNDTVNVLVRALPNANAGTDQFMCGACANLLATGGSSYLWSPAINLSSPNTAATQACPQMSMDYVATVTDVYGCVNTDTVHVTVYPPLQVLASTNVAVCPGSPATISAVGSGGDGGTYTYSWTPAAGLTNPNAATTTANPSTTTTYVVTVTDQCGSPAAVDSVVVTVYPLPVLSVTPSQTEGCAPVCVTFTGTSVPAAASCLYDFGDLNTSTNCNPSNCYINDGTYTVTYTVTDVNGCSNTITYPNMITVHPLPVAGFTVSPQTTSIINPIVNVNPNCTSCDTTIYYMNDPLDTALISNLGLPFSFEYSDTGYFMIMQVAISQYGCVDTAFDYVLIEPDWSFFAPNAFTPNGDGRNDKFMVYGEGIDNSTFELFVFDRWGNLIFVVNDINKGWDGTVYSSDLAQIDTYVWRVKFKDIKGDPHSYVGQVSLIR
jgi:gliding motility-associated-like protein